MIINLIKTNIERCKNVIHFAFQNCTCLIKSSENRRMLNSTCICEFSHKIRNEKLQKSNGGIFCCQNNNDQFFKESQSLKLQELGFETSIIYKL